MSKTYIGIVASAIFLIAFTSCTKVNVDFEDNTNVQDPNVTYFDNYKVNISTYTIDSFITSNHNVISVGYHNDPLIGVMKSASYMELVMPPNTVENQTVVFDSLNLVLHPSGNFYGDSSLPISIVVHPLNQNIAGTKDGSYYNTSSFSYDTAVIGKQSVSLFAKTGTEVNVRLSDSLGKDLLGKFQTGAVEVSSQAWFLNYLKGLYITCDSSSTNSIAYFNLTKDSAVVRLSYHQSGLYYEKKEMDFPINLVNQFNNVSCRYTNSNLQSIIPQKKQLVSSTLTGHQCFLNTSMGSSIKIDFPTLLNLRDAHPYVNVVKAQLLVRVDPSSLVFPYQLPNDLLLELTDDKNQNISTYAYGFPTIDKLYGYNTYYSFDITSFINNKIKGGYASNAALMLTSAVNYDASIQRLIVNDQSSDRPIQLKLYVLGL